MTYLIDSDWVADALKGRPVASALLTNLLPDGLAISTITFGEIYEGIHYGTNPQGYLRVFRQFLRGVRVLPVTRSVAKEFAIVRGQLRQQGQLLPEPDLLIAATALRHHLILVTRNTRHFARVTGLTLHPVAPT
jgi:tRNA(fMet)-specific endonuclease VapC